MEDSPGESWSGLIVNDPDAPLADEGTTTESVTLPENPLLDRVRVVLVGFPAPTVGGVGADATIAKSGWTVTCTVVVWTSVPLPPDTVIV